MSAKRKTVKRVDVPIRLEDEVMFGIRRIADKAKVSVIIVANVIMAMALIKLEAKPKEKTTRRKRQNDAGKR